MGITEATFGTKSRNQQPGFRVLGSGRDLATDTTKLATTLSGASGFCVFFSLSRALSRALSIHVPPHGIGNSPTDRASRSPSDWGSKAQARSTVPPMPMAVLKASGQTLERVADVCRKTLSFSGSKARVNSYPTRQSSRQSSRQSLKTTAAIERITCKTRKDQFSQRPNFKFQISNFKSTKLATKLTTKFILNPEPWCLKSALAALALLALCNSASAEDAPARRNPFWPVGYAPKSATGLEIVVAPPPKLSDEELWLQTPVGPDEWAAALAALPKPGGMFIGPHPETRARVDKMVLMGRTFHVGQEFTTTNNAVAFTWKVDYISFKEKDYRLSQVLAERIPGGRTGKK